MAFTVRGKMAIHGAATAEHDMLRVASAALRALSIINLTRYVITDIQQLASGKGGFGDIISLTTNSIILMYQLQQLMIKNLALAGTLKIAIGLMGGPIGVAAGAGLIIGGAVAGYGMYQYGQGVGRVQGGWDQRRAAARAIGIQ